MHVPSPESQQLLELREQLRAAAASAMMEWRAIDVEEERALRAGEYKRAGRLSGLKADVMLRFGLSPVRSDSRKQP